MRGCCIIATAQIFMQFLPVITESLMATSQLVDINADVVPAASYL